MKSIETHTRTFYPLNISAIGSVLAEGHNLRGTVFLADRRRKVLEFQMNLITDLDFKSGSVISWPAPNLERLF